MSDDRPPFESWWNTTALKDEEPEQFAERSIRGWHIEPQYDDRDRTGRRWSGKGPVRDRPTTTPVEEA